MLRGCCSPSFLMLLLLGSVLSVFCVEAFSGTEQQPGFLNGVALRQGERPEPSRLEAGACENSRYEFQGLACCQVRPLTQMQVLLLRRAC